MVAVMGVAIVIGLRAEQLATPARWTLSGRVVDAATGQPVAGAGVVVASDGKPLRTYRATSGADGSYHFDTLRSGHYYVFVPVTRRTTGSGSSSQSALLPEALTAMTTGQPFTYATTFYPSALTSSSGQAVAVTPTQPRPGINIGLRRVFGHRVTGTVTGRKFSANGPGESLVLLSDDDQRFELGAPLGGSATASTLTQDGPFVFLNVPPGRYTLEAWPAVRGSIVAPRERRVSLTVGDSDVSGVMVIVPVRDR